MLRIIAPSRTKGLGLLLWAMKDVKWENTGGCSKSSDNWHLSVPAV